MKKLLLLLVLFATPAYAQTGPCSTISQATFQANPTRGCFNPDLTANRGSHNAVDPISGVPDVTRYDLQFFLEGVDVTNPSNNPIQTSPLGKPTPNSDGTIWFGQGTAVPLPSYPVGQRLKSVIVPVGPGGSGSRGALNTSNPFGQSGPVVAPRAPSGLRLTEG